jgi:hypothetical protein
LDETGKRAGGLLASRLVSLRCVHTVQADSDWVVGELNVDGVAVDDLRDGSK